MTRRPITSYLWGGDSVEAVPGQKFINTNQEGTFGLLRVLQSHSRYINPNCAGRRPNQKRTRLDGLPAGAVRILGCHRRRLQGKDSLYNVCKRTSVRSKCVTTK